MKFSKLGVMFAAATIAAGAFADAANVLITFSTDGDTYADGTEVKEGEWYALCWAGDGEFDGLNLDCTPVNPDEQVLKIGSYARKLSNGKVGCPPHMFQIDSAVARKLEGGSYVVYLLDTRTVTDEGSLAPAEKTDANLPASVNAVAAVEDCNASASIGGNIASADATSAATAWTASAVNLPVTTEAKIAGIAVANATVTIDVVGMMPGLMYNVKMGATPTALEEYVVSMPATGSTSATFEVPAESAKFFKVVRWPEVSK